MDANRYLWVEICLHLSCFQACWSQNTAINLTLKSLKNAIYLKHILCDINEDDGHTLSYETHCRVHSSIPGGTFQILLHLHIQMFWKHKHFEQLCTHFYLLNKKNSVWVVHSSVLARQDVLRNKVCGIEGFKKWYLKAP